MLLLLGTFCSLGIGTSFGQTKVNLAEQATPPGNNGQLLFNNAGSVGAEDPVVSQPTASLLNATVVGTLTNNNAAPNALNLGVLPCLAGSSAPTNTTGDQVLLSCDLSGNIRVVIPGSVAVTGTFFQTTQPVSCTAANCLFNLSQWAGTALGVPTNFGTTPGAVIAGSVNSSLFLGTVAAATAASGVQKVGITGSTGVSLDSTAGVLDFNLKNEAGTAVTNTPTAIGTLGTGNVISANVDLTSEHGTAVTNVPTAIGTKGAGNVISVNTDMTSVAGTATVTSAAGVQKVGVVGNAGATVDSTVGAGTAPTNQVVVGCQFNTTQPAPTNAQALALQCDSAGVLEANIEGKKATYRASTAASFAPANTIIFTFFGSATKTIRVTHLFYSFSTASAIATSDILRVSIIKHSTADSGGTCTTLTQVPMDANNAAGTATFVNSCTVNPSTIGTTVGTISTWNCILTLNNSTTTDFLGNCQGDLLNPGGNFIPAPQDLTLRGTAQGIDVNLSAVIPTTAQAQFTIEWTEE